MKKIQNIYYACVAVIEKFLAPLLLLAIRIWIGMVFLKSGLVKFSNIDQTITLFTYEYNLPFLPPAFAAISAMSFEIGCGILIICGLLTRIAALPLIAMAIIIQSLVFQNIEHFYWMFLLTVLTVFGGGKISLDYLLCRFCVKAVK